jgi:hypothetical protein
MKLDSIFEVGLRILEFEKMCYDWNCKVFKWEEFNLNFAPK